MPNLAAESEPLRRLLNLPDNEFCWGVDQRNAYETLKLILTSDKLLQYYDSRKPVVIQTDASTAGLGAVLMQEDKPVDYASRSLTKSESNYAPIELECLAIIITRVRPSKCDDSLRSSSTRSDYEKIATRRSKSNTSDDANPPEVCIHSEVETRQRTGDRRFVVATHW